LPAGYTLLLYGEPKSGKTLIANDFISKLHQDDPEAYVIKFNSEFRENLQGKSSMFNFDYDRYKACEANSPGEVFDTIEQKIPEMIQSGYKIKLIVIDSLNGILGNREMLSDSVENHQIGDNAMTLQKGLKRIIPVLRRNKIAMICTSQVRAELDMWAAKRSPVKPGLSWGALHGLEYIVQVIQDKTSAGKILDEEKKVNDKALQTGHNIKCVITASTCSPPGRCAEFTLSYTEGIVRLGEEIGVLAKNLGVVHMPNDRTYQFDGQEWKSKDAWWNAIENDLVLRNKVIEAIKKTDKITKL
jgi:RecA/RadA recombinase